MCRVGLRTVLSRHGYNYYVLISNIKVVGGQITLHNRCNRRSTIVRRTIRDRRRLKDEKKLLLCKHDIVVGTHHSTDTLLFK